MFEEAFEIYKKFGLKTKAIKVLLEQMEDLSRAQEYATKVGLSESLVWGSLIHVCLFSLQCMCPFLRLSWPSALWHAWQQLETCQCFFPLLLNRGSSWAMLWLDSCPAHSVCLRATQYNFPDMM